MHICVSQQCCFATGHQQVLSSREYSSAAGNMMAMHLLAGVLERYLVVLDKLV